MERGKGSEIKQGILSIWSGTIKNLITTKRGVIYAKKDKGKSKN